MNERIEKLASECYQAPEFDYKKFAELIIKECINLLPYDCQSDNGCHTSYVIKEHFGVE